MTAEGPKWKLWKYTDMYIKLWVFKKKKLFDLIMTYMTSDDRGRSKMKALKIYWYVY